MRFVLALAAGLLLAGAQAAQANKAAEAEKAFAADHDEEALRLYGEAIAESAGDPAALAAAYFGRGEIYVLDGKAELAIADFTAALGLPQDPPSRANTYFSRAEAKSRRRLWEPALADYAEALKLAPTMSGAHFARARALRALGRKDEALAEIDAELKIDPTSYRALSIRADLLGLPPPPETHPREARGAGR